jgi:hypothetical protein
MKNIRTTGNTRDTGSMHRNPGCTKQSQERHGTKETGKPFSARKEHTDHREHRDKLETLETKITKV